MAWYIRHRSEEVGRDVLTGGQVTLQVRPAMENKDPIQNLGAIGLKFNMFGQPSLQTSSWYSKAIDIV
jgi:hypothetical protein